MELTRNTESAQSLRAKRENPTHDSAQPQKPVHYIWERVKVPIFGCGGIANWRDAVEFLLAGASAVQIGTAIAAKGPNVFRSITIGIGNYLKRKGFRSVSEIVGLAHKS